MSLTAKRATQEQTDLCSRFTIFFGNKQTENMNEQQLKYEENDILHKPRINANNIRRGGKRHDFQH